MADVHPNVRYRASVMTSLVGSVGWRLTRKVNRRASPQAIEPCSPKPSGSSISPRCVPGLPWTASMKICFVFSLYSQAIAVLRILALADDPSQFYRSPVSKAMGGSGQGCSIQKSHVAKSLDPASPFDSSPHPNPLPKGEEPTSGHPLSNALIGVPSPRRRRLEATDAGLASEPGDSGPPRWINSVRSMGLAR